MAGFRPLYTLSGGPIFSKGWGITASEAWARHAVVAWDSAGTLVEPSADNADVLGVALEAVTGGASGGPRTNVCLVVPFTYDTVFAVKEVANLANTPLVTDIGNDRDLDYDSTNGWGIHASGSATAATPQFRVVDIDTIRNEWHVIANPTGIADVFQWFDGAA